jgi:flagellum-specific peptidoglycan hydrolase FlgJ
MLLSREASLNYRNRALEKLTEIRKQSMQETKKPSPKTVYSKYIFEQYNDGKMENKLKHDSAYFNVLFEHIDDEDIGHANQLLADLSKTVKSIYENINIEPRSIGAQAISLSDSDDIIEKNATRVIHEFIDTNYYSLSQEARHAKYKEAVIAEAEAQIY